ncbi:MAG: esterase family protein [Rhodospirillales bacterium]|nr:esterase family protein [Rhodospirillales bacterium]
MKREYHKWYSPALGRDMELLVFGHRGARVLAFPPRCGRFFDYENNGIIDVLRHHLNEGWLQVICVDSIDPESFYCNWCNPRDRVFRHMAFERYILQEVLPLSETINGTPYLTSLGCSFGAYHAVNIAFRHPHRFNRVVAMSGRYDLTQAPEGFRDLLDGHYDQDVYFNMPNHYMANVGMNGILAPIRRLDIKLIIGEQDPFLDDNRRLSDILWLHGVWHLFKVWDGRAHSYRRWREMIGWFV